MSDQIENADDDGPTLSYDKELGAGYYVRLPSAFIRLPATEYDAYSKVAYGVLLSYAASGDTAWPGMKRLATEVGCSERHLRDVMDSLIAGRLLSVKRRGLGKTNVYHIHKFDEAFKKAGEIPPQNTHAQIANPERHHVPIKSGTTVRSESAPVADKLQYRDTNNTEETEKSARALFTEKEADPRPVREANATLSTVHLSHANMPGGQVIDPAHAFVARQSPTDPTCASVLLDFKQRFDRLWSMHPRKVGQAAAATACGRLTPADFAALTRALPAFLPAWNELVRRGEANFIPHFSTFINQRRWEDDPPPMPGTKPLRSAQAPAPPARVVRSVPLYQSTAEEIAAHEALMNAPRPASKPPQLRRGASFDEIFAFANEPEGGDQDAPTAPTYPN